LGKSISLEWEFKSYLFWVLLIAVPIGIGVTIEMIQASVPGRTREYMDIVFNVLGTVLGLTPFIKRVN
jgi:VanZ family protein